jgi:hypothetical protein
MMTDDDIYTREAPDGRKRVWRLSMAAIPPESRLVDDQ